MAEISEEQVMVCPYFLKGTCREREEDCAFAHEMTAILPKDVACEYHLRGYCKYGKKCYLSHGEPRESENDSENMDNNKSADSNVNEDQPVKIKKRFSFILNYIRKKRKARMIDNLISSDLPPHYTDMLRNPNHFKDLPMDNCVHYDLGKCPLGILCPCTHGRLCDICQKYCLDPNDREQNHIHLVECEKALERDMELSFSIQCSKDKVCGICLEVIFDKEKFLHRRFGILEKCNHVFCLQCIREWRRRGRVMDQLQAESASDHRVMRKCPTCRAVSDFVTPSNFWFHNKEEKANIIAKYKSGLKSKPCKYFEQGAGTCPFGGRCFYLHATPDGEVIDLPPPTRQPRRRNRPTDAALSEELILWHYLEDRRSDLESLQHDIDDIMDNMDISIDDTDFVELHRSFLE